MFEKLDAVHKLIILIFGVAGSYYSIRATLGLQNKDIGNIEKRMLLKAEDSEIKRLEGIINDIRKQLDKLFEKADHNMEDISELKTCIEFIRDQVNKLED